MQHMCYIILQRVDGVEKVSVLLDYISSDHRPLSVEFSCSLMTELHEPNALSQPEKCVKWNYSTTMSYYHIPKGIILLP